MVTRTAKQCRERYFNHLKADLHKGRWTAEEDAQLCHLKTSIGGQWVVISRAITGRSENSVKNRWHLLERNKDLKKPALNVVVSSKTYFQLKLP